MPHLSKYSDRTHECYKAPAKIRGAASSLIKIQGAVSYTSDRTSDHTRDNARSLFCHTCENAPSNKMRCSAYIFTAL